MLKTLSRTARNAFSSIYTWTSVGAAALGAASAWAGETLAPSWMWWLIAYAALCASLFNVQFKLDRATETSPPRTFDMPLYKLVERIVGFSESAANDKPDSGLVAYSAAFREIRQKAALGELHARAQRVRLAADSLMTDVGRDEWEAATLNLEAFLRGDEVRFSNNERCNFWFSSEQVDRLWKPPRRRLVLVPFWRWEQR